MKNNITNKEMADFLGVHESFISLILSDNRRIGLSLAEKIKERCGMSYDYIFETEAKHVFQAVKRSMPEGENHGTR